MEHSTDSSSRSHPHSAGVVSRAQTDQENNTAEPALTSGFGLVIGKERDLQRATEDVLGRANGNRAVEIERVLRQQHSRLGANIALLEERYEALPNPARFASRDDRRHPADGARRTEPREKAAPLLDLMARHNSLVTDLAALMSSAPDGQRGELILTVVSRSHREMAETLGGLLP
jgi:hypothetical protein